jgi:rod shape determining protein RodA
MLIGLIFFGSTINGSTSWYSFGAFSFQPSDTLKLIVILILAKYLARRHVEIKAIKHVFITALYVLIPFLLIFIQPDFGSAAILLAIWLGMILVSGISKKHIVILVAVAGIIGAGLWVGVFEDYQKNRIISFLNPLSDTQGTGYNAYQSTIAVGSGQLWGKGVGYGTQSRLHFLPEYETDFIFAAVAEEWGFIGSLIVVFLLLGIIVRILILGSRMNSNFELLFAVGLAVYFLSHAIINIGMNIGLLPVTGVTLPFLSYGGSHLLIEFAGLGILMSFARNTRNVHSETKTEIFLR